MEHWYLNTGPFGPDAANPLTAHCVEAHPISCAACRRATAAAVPAERLATIWSRICAELHATPDGVCRGE